MSKEKLLLISFDYELFLGEKTGTVQQCLIKPTDQIISCLKKYAFKAVFFIDTVYILRLREIAGKYPVAKTDLDLIMGQLVQLVKNGHEIHPHIHPHWIDALYNPASNEWDLREKRYYTFASLSENKQSGLFSESVSLIKSVLEKVNSTQPIDSYRAGGWSIEPFRYFRPLFIQYDIKYDWSVIPGKYQVSDAHSFDFRKAPGGIPVYRFSEAPCRKEENGPFTEFTISTLTMNRIETWIDFKISGMMQRFGWRPAHKGKTVSSIIKEEGDLYSNGRNKRIIASFEGLNPFTLKKYVSNIGTSGYFQFISHPKLITPFEFKMIDKLFRKLKSKFEIQTDFRKFIS